MTVPKNELEEKGAEHTPGELKVTPSPAKEQLDALMVLTKENPPEIIDNNLVKQAKKVEELLASKLQTPELDAKTGQALS